MPTVSEVLVAGAEQLEEAKASDTPALDAEVLLGFVMQRSRAALLADKDGQLTEFELTHYKELIDDRARWYPVAYMTGEKEFWSMTLTVNEKVLIPRPDTEVLVERALLRADKDASKALDLGTGSGAIALALASELPGCAVTAVDFSSGAIEIAERNRLRHQLENVAVQQGDWFTGLPEHAFDLIVSNPPYIDPMDAHLDSELRYEPQGALVAMENGMSDLGFLIREAPGYLAEGGWLLLEHGYDQAERVRALMIEVGYLDVMTTKDLGGNDRVTEGRLDLPAPQEDQTNN